MDADVIVVGAGPTGLMPACELRLAGVRPLVLERRSHRRDTAKAGGLASADGSWNCCAPGACWSDARPPAPVPFRRPGSRSAVSTSI